MREPELPLDSRGPEREDDGFGKNRFRLRIGFEKPSAGDFKPRRAWGAPLAVLFVTAKPLRLQ
jgi:hypothetical protein